jgi:hypothetical protein
MRTAAEVLPAQLTGLPVDVVVDRQLANTDRKVCALGLVCCRGTLQADQLQLVGLVSQFSLCVLIRQGTASEQLARLDDLLHALAETVEVFRREGSVDVEVVVEAVLDRRSDPELGSLEAVLYRLREHVRARVPDDRPTILGVRPHRLHDVAILNDVLEIPELVVDPSCDDRPIVADEVQSGRARRHRLTLGLRTVISDNSDNYHGSLLGRRKGHVSVDYGRHPPLDGS